MILLHQGNLPCSRLEVWSTHQCWVQRDRTFPSPVGHKFFHTNQDSIDVPGHLGTHTLAQIQLMLTHPPDLFPLDNFPATPLFPDPLGGSPGHVPWVLTCSLVWGRQLWVLSGWIWDPSYFPCKFCLSVSRSCKFLKLIFNFLIWYIIR